MSTVFAIQNSENPTDLTWYLSESDGAAIEVDPSDLSRSGAGDVVLIASGRDVFLGEVEIIARNDREMRSAALFHLEDDLAEAPSGLHVAIGNKRDGDSNRRQVAVISRSLMDQFQDSLDDVKLPANARVRIVPDTSLFLEGYSAPTLFDGDDLVLVNTGVNCYSLDAETASQIAPALISEDGLSDIDYIRGDRPVLVDGVPGINLNLESAKSYPELIANLLSVADGLDLKQAEFRSKSDVDLGFARKWLGTLGIAAAACCLWLVYLGVSAHQLNEEADRLYQNSVSAYQAAFPDDQPVVDPLAQTRARLNSGQGSLTNQPSLSVMLPAFYTGLERVDGVEVIDLAFNQQTGRLSSRLRFSSYESRDQLKQIMESAGMRVEFPNVSQSDGFLIGQVVLEHAS